MERWFFKEHPEGENLRPRSLDTQGSGAPLLLVPGQDFSKGVACTDQGPRVLIDAESLRSQPY